MKHQKDITSKGHRDTFLFMDPGRHAISCRGSTKVYDPMHPRVSIIFHETFYEKTQLENFPYVFLASELLSPGLHWPSNLKFGISTNVGMVSAAYYTVCPTILPGAQVHKP